MISRRPAALSTVLGETLTHAQHIAFEALPRYDQVHHFCVYQRLSGSGITDRDLLTAALLHDLGKAALGSRVRLVDRALAVTLAKLAPALHKRVTRLPAPRWRTGLALTVHHPRIGAELAAGLGLSARTCWLIEHHGDADPPVDRDLRQLIAADSAC